MGRLTKSKCEHCAINVEFDASCLHPGEFRKVPCPNCGTDILCFSSASKKSQKNAGLKTKDLSAQANLGFREDDPLLKYRHVKPPSRTFKSPFKLPTVERSTKKFGVSRGVVALWFLGILTISPWLICFALCCADDNWASDSGLAGLIFGGCGFSVVTGLFLLFLFFDVEKRKCPNCGKWGALRDTGSSSVVSSTDATERELRNAFIGQQLGRPEEMITYLQDVKVKKHTTVGTSRCIFCGDETELYDSYTTKS